METAGKLGKFSKGKHTTEREKGMIEAYLRLKLFTAADIGEKVGKSGDVVERLAKKLGLSTIGHSRKTDAFKARIAELFGDVALKMLESINKMTPKELKKISPVKLAIMAGIFTDKYLKLTEKKEPATPKIGVSLNWWNLVGQMTPNRKKDEAPQMIESELVEPQEEGVIQPDGRVV